MRRSRLADQRRRRRRNAIYVVLRALQKRHATFRFSREQGRAWAGELQKQGATPRGVWNYFANDREAWDEVVEGAEPPPAHGRGVALNPRGRL